MKTRYQNTPRRSNVDRKERTVPVTPRVSDAWVRWKCACGNETAGYSNSPRFKKKKCAQCAYPERLGVAS